MARLCPELTYAQTFQSERNMQYPTLQLLVTHADESVTKGFGSTHIPTFGHVATSFDAYRTAGVHSITNRPLSWCLTDTDAQAALGRVIDGPITSYLDIERAESALRAVLLHQSVELLVPCVKAQYETGFIGYMRFDKQERNDAAFAAFDVAYCRDLLFATEFITTANGQILSSTNPQSRIVGGTLENPSSHYRSLLSTACETATALPMALGAATHYSSPELGAAMNNGAAGFIDDLYKRIYRPWVEVAQSGPSLHVDVKLPPLLAIVLSRAATREKIPEVIRELRNELAPARANLHEMNDHLERAMTQADINAFVQKINSAFDAIVPEALLTDGERRKRRLLSIFGFMKPVREIYSLAADPLTANPEKFKELFASTQTAVAMSSRMVNRSVAAVTLAELLRVESVRNTILTHFDYEEVKMLSIRQG